MNDKSAKEADSAPDFSYFSESRKLMELFLSMMDKPEKYYESVLVDGQKRELRVTLKATY